MVLIDFDMVLNLAGERCVVIIRKEYQEKISLMDILNWEHWLKYPKVIEVFHNWEDYIHLCKPRKGAIALLHRLNEKYNVHILTHTQEGVKDQKEKYIQEVYNWTNIIHEEEKFKYAKGNILIDDAIHNIRAHIEHGGFHAILFDLGYGWNQEKIEEEFENVTRVTSYEELERVVDKLKSEQVKK